MTFLAWVLVLLEIGLLAAAALLRARAPVGSPWRLHEAMLAWQTLYFTGAAALLVTSPGNDTTTFVLMACLAQLSLTATALVLSARRTPAPVVRTVMRRGEQTVAWAVALVSSAVCLAFIVAILRNEELLLILAGVVTGDERFLDFRTTMTSGTAVYLAPGYVKQFRDVLLPAALIALVAFSGRTRWWLVVPMGLVGFGAAILSGERFSLMVYILAFGFALALRPESRRLAVRVVAPVFAVVLLAAFVGSTILLGRADADSGLLTIIGDSVAALFDRIVLTLPRENAGGFEVWYPLAPTWGRNWLSAISGILPGSQTGLDQELHEVLGGSALGSSPLGLAPDTFLAWGVVGTVLFPALFCLALERADAALIESGSPLAKSLRVALVPLSFAWYSPFLFLLSGGAVLVGGAIALSVTSRADR